MGPNCLGIIRPGGNLNASFASEMPDSGDLAFISPSGAICTAILDLAFKEHIGFSHFVSIGSMLDVDFGDLIDYLGNDPSAKSILLYIESLTTFRKFMSAARSVSRIKPIIVLKAGRSEAGTGRALRIEFLAGVLTRLGYQVEIRGDMLQASLRTLDCPAMQEVLDQTGRLLGCSRLLDLAIPNQAEVQRLTELFYKKDYDFLGRSEARLPGFYASVGEWSRAKHDGQDERFFF